MKPRRGTLAGILVVIVAVVTLIVISIFPSKYVYTKMKVNVDILQALKGNFRSLSFRNATQSVGGLNKYILTPLITVVSGNPGTYNGVIRTEAIDTILRFNFQPPPFNYDVSLVQIDSLCSIPQVAYFIVVARKYSLNPTMVSYIIRPYKINGELIDLNRAYLRLNPCPPALAYQSTDRN